MHGNCFWTNSISVPTFASFLFKQKNNNNTNNKTQANISIPTIHLCNFNIRQILLCHLSYPNNHFYDFKSVRCTTILNATK